MDEADMNAQDRTLQNVTGTRFWLALTFCGAQLADRTRRDSNPQLQQEFVGDSGLAPNRVASGHFANQFPQMGKRGVAVHLSCLLNAPDQRA